MLSNSKLDMISFSIKNRLVTFGENKVLWDKVDTGEIDGALWKILLQDDEELDFAMNLVHVPTGTRMRINPRNMQELILVAPEGSLIVSYTSAEPIGMDLEGFTITFEGRTEYIEYASDEGFIIG